MLYIPKVREYSKILTDDEVKNFVAIEFEEYFRSRRETLYYTLNEEQNLRKVAKLLYIFQTTPDEVEKYLEVMQSDSVDNYVDRYKIRVLNLFNSELQLTNTKSMIKSKLRELLGGFKKFKVQTILVLEHKKRSDCKIFHLSTKLIASDSDINKAFIFMHQSITTKIKN